MKIITNLILILSFGVIYAAPWIEPNDIGLRNDLQLLADYGILSTPLTTWPVSWGNIAREVLAESIMEIHDPAVMAALERVRAQAQEILSDRKTHATLEVKVSEQASPLTNFANHPYESAETSLSIERTGTHFAYRLKVTGVSNALDNRDVRFDDSYISRSLGNWMVGVGAIDQWWGPSWQGSLILGNNARPVPGIFLQRNYSNPFKTRWLSWLGPWHFTAFIGQLEQDREIPNAKLLGARLSFKPTAKLEIGLSRTGQWAGNGRPNDLDSLVELLLGQSNVDLDASSRADELADDPGNQLGGIDFRWRSPLGNAPYAFYGQIIGEDEAGGLPSRSFALFGLEFWKSFHQNYLRVNLEYTNTLVRKGLFSGEEFYASAYDNGIYRSGYTYYGKVLGHSLSGDGELTSLQLLLTRPNGHLWGLVMQGGQIKKSSVADFARNDGPLADIFETNIFHHFDWKDNQIKWGLGYWQETLNSNEESDFQFFINFSRQF